MTTSQLSERPPAHNSSTRPPRGRSGRARRRATALGVVFMLAAGMGSGPLVAVSSAQSSSVLQQSAGGAAPGGATERARSAPGAGGGADRLNAAPDFSGPGVEKGLSLVGWAKAAALLIGTLTLIVGVPVSKALKEAGNHHASGVRAGAMGVGGSILLAGIAGTALPWLMG